MTTKQDYYETLGLRKEESPSKDVIKKAYRKLAMKHHPDRNPGDKESEQRFKEINEAYSVLSDEQKRANYDQFGHSGFDQSHMGGGASGFGDFADVFKDFFGGDFADAFGGGSRRQRSRTQPGDDLLFELQLSLEECFSGIEKTIRLANIVGCDHCDGSGAADGSKPVTCSTCNGSGQVRMQQGFLAIQQPCPRCQGQGQTIDKPCSPCQGHGRVRKQCSYQVRIPKGINHGNKIRLSGKGEAGSFGGPDGDLYIQIQLKEHATFARKGQDLTFTVPIDMPTAALGGAIDVTLLNGERLKVKIPKESQTGHQLRIGGKGMPAFHRQKTGDLYCQLFVETPISLDKDQKELMEKLSQSLTDKQRNQSKGWLNRLKRFMHS